MAIVIFAGKGMYGITYDRQVNILSSVDRDEAIIACNSEETEVLKQECIDGVPSVSELLYMGG